MNKIIKDQLSKLKPSATLAINEQSEELKKIGKKIYKFGFGQSPFQIPSDIVTELKNNAYQNKYLPMQGLSQLRTAISKYENKKNIKNYKAENVIIGPGTKELMFLLQILFDGEILLPAPSWVSYAPQSIIAKNKFHWIKTKSENNWFPKAEEIEEIILKNKNKKYLMILNSPNNPSGQICTNLSEISELAKKYNLYFLSDEIYSELTFEGNYESISNYCPENTIISTGLSKWCGAGGWRLGYFILPNNLSEITSQLKVLASETFSSVSSPIQYAAISAHKNDHTNYIKHSINILKTVGNYVYENLKSNNVLINKPQGGFYLLPEFINKKFSTSAELCNNILKETGVALLPGSDFGFSEKRMLVRLSYTDFDGENFMKNTVHNEEINNDIIKKYAPKIIEGTNKLKEWSNN